MPRKKQLTIEERFPHDGFPFRLEFAENGNNKVCWFTHEVYLNKHLDKYKIKEYNADAAPGYNITPAKTKRPKRSTPNTKPSTPVKPTAPTKPKKASDTKASKASKAKKSSISATKTKSKAGTTKKATKKVFSTLDTFFE